MAAISNFEQLVARLSETGKRQRIAVVDGIDASTINALQRAVASGFASVIFVGKAPELNRYTEFQRFAEHVSLVAPADGMSAAETAVALVRERKADVLMKGLIHTSDLLRAVLNKERGILPKGEILTHIACAQVPAYDKLLFFTDSAVMPLPTDEQRERQVEYAVGVTRAFGIEQPRLSLIHFTEEVSEKFPITAHYRHLVEEAKHGRWGNAIIDGPLDVRTSVDPVALSVKGIDSPIQGRADVLIMPNLETGNAFYKTLSFFGSARIAGTLCGPTCPVILSSRGDDSDSKFFSLAFASLVAHEATK